MLPAIKDDRFESLTIELLKLLHDNDIDWVLRYSAKSTNGFRDSGIRRVICEQVSALYPVASQKWATQTNFWSDEVSEVVAATYPGNMTGIEELMQTKQYGPIKGSQILAAFIVAISQGHILPTWFCEFAQNNIELLPKLLLSTDNVPRTVVKIVKKILDEVPDLPVTRVFQVEEINTLISSYEYFSRSLTKQQ